MKIMIYSVYDSKTGVFGQPNFLINRGAALRAWQEAANDPQSNICKYPSDFTMFEIGYWEDETGTITMLDAKISLGTALEFKRDEQQFPVKNLIKDFETTKTTETTEVNQ